MSKRKVVLASTSRYRRALLERAGLGHFECVAPDCDEEVRGKIEPDELVRRLAERKAASVASQHPDALIVGADQVVEIDGEVLGKPGTAQRAVSQLERLAGREHRLLTGLCVLEAATGRRETEIDVHRMMMWPLDRTRLERYVALDRPLDCAGAYKIESKGIALFQAMRGDDYTAIVGLPLTAVARLLSRFGVVMLDLVE